ncbi:SusC/RagA family TonB-linked outer membrane protein [Mucilaginibacter sp. SP1R1]|uniref:SusC/RagA family TonB-linked outer membrane protein n=1 Tax=Mucilaginibacter sp. SP1R1 TaxID=2723091 RepID=UPI00161349E4|nr:SusC/RagA family TonB-linked outer membrane protein [Mucilaginibacter sp. SP1R1]MBB6149922.1 TonB-linked SusC/RagA family outer membrane protein [Mucilaginibacter sp. SP1R1]
MKKEYITLFAWIFSFCSFSVANAQTTNVTSADSIKAGNNAVKDIVDGGLRTEKSWRNTGAVFTLPGEELTRMTSGNLLNTLQGRIPGLTVVTTSGEPGYDNPTLYVRGQSSWNIAGNQVIIYLDGFQVDMGAISGLSAYEIESVTLLKDAAALAVYGLQGGAGVLSIRTKKGSALPKTQITVNGKYGILSAIDLPTVMDAYGYTTAYNQALQNDGLPIKYPNPSLYKASNDPFHPNVNWYDELLKKTSTIQDYNFSFRGGNKTAKYFVLMNYTNFEGLYKNADIIDKDFGTNAKYTKLNLRANVELQLNKNLAVVANISGITEDRNTPSGFTAADVFNNLLRIPAAAFPVKNPNGSWGNSSVYSFNPVELLQQNGVYSSHTRNLQTNFGFTQKLDAITPGLDLKGSVSFSNQYVGTYQKLFSVPSYEITKDANDQPVLDANGKVVYKTIGTISQSSPDGGGALWNRNAVQLGFDYDRSFGKSAFTGMLTAVRQSYGHSGQIYQVRIQGLSGNVTYDYDKKYIVDLSAAYNGSADFAPGHRYGFFPAVGLGWIASKEDFLKDNSAIDFLKVRASYGTTGNINEAYRFLYQQFAISAPGWITGTSNTGQSGRTEGPNANANAAWEQKTTLNIGIDLTLWKKLSATVDVFKEKRTGIMEIPSADVPDYTGFALQYANTGEVSNKGLEASLNFKDKINSFEYNIGGSAAFARNKITKRSESPEPYNYLYTQGYQLGQMRGLVYKGFYQQSDFDASGKLKPGVVSSSYANVKPGDLKFADQDGNGIINDYDKIPLNYAKLPEITLGFNLGFKYKGFDFDAYLEGVLHRTVSLLDDAYTYTHPFVNNNNITSFSANSWTPQTANTATTPRLSTLSNANNDQQSDFWMRNGDFVKLRSVELGYTLPQKGFLKKLDAIRFFVNGTNLFTWDKIDDLEAERLSMGYPLMKVVTFGLKVKL